MGTPAAAGSPAAALRTLGVPGNSPSPASPPATRPDRRRNVRRSSPLVVPATRGTAVPRGAGRSDRFTSIVWPSLRWVAIDAVVSLNFSRVRLVLGSALVAPCSELRRCGWRNSGYRATQDGCGACRGYDQEHITTSHHRNKVCAGRATASWTKLPLRIAVQWRPSH